MSSNPLRLKFLLGKYLENNCSSQELEEFWRLMSSLSDNDLILFDIKQLWHKTDHSGPDDENHWNQAFGRLLQKIEDQRKNEIRSKTEYPLRVKRKKMIRMAAAASLLAAVMTIGWYIQQNMIVSKSADQKVNQASAHQIITLPDGTTVTLNNGSKLDYPATFNGSARNVYLTGEAYFDVNHDPGKPFLVHTGTYVVKVLGTAFNIKSYPGENNMEVTVTRGKVQVQNTNDKKDLGILLPGEKLLIDKSSAKADIVKADIPKTLEWKSEDMIFNNITLDEAAVIISNRYSRELRFENNLLRNCRFTGKFPDDSDFEELLDIVCELTKSSWKKEGGSVILLSGEGCE